MGVFISLRMRCRSCGIWGHGEAALDDNGRIATYDLPQGWARATEHSKLVVFCSQLCMTRWEKGFVTRYP